MGQHITICGSKHKRNIQIEILDNILLHHDVEHNLNAGIQLPEVSV